MNTTDLSPVRAARSRSARVTVWAHLVMLLGLSLSMAPSHAQDSPALQTLRDNSALTGLSPQPEIKRWQDRKPIERNYAKQPPIIPHTTKGYVINLKFNKCLTCHSDQNAEISGAPPVSTTHYTDRNNNFTPKIAGRRYFCVQCHVPQMEPERLVPNDFSAEEHAE